MDQKPFNSSESDRKRMEKDISYQNVQNIPPPPPSYPDSQTQSNSVKQQPPEIAQAETTAYPLQAHHTPAPSLTLPVTYTSWVGNHIHIFPPNSNPKSDSPLYVADIKMSKPHITFNTTNPFTPFGTVTYHTFHARIDTVIHSTPTELSHNSHWKSAYSFPSSFACPGRTLMWKHEKWSSCDWVCVDQETGVMVAKFFFEGWNRKKMCSMAVFERSCGVGSQGLDEIMVTGCALAHFTVFMTTAANPGMLVTLKRDG